MKSRKMFLTNTTVLFVLLYRECEHNKRLPMYDLNMISCGTNDRNKSMAGNSLQPSHAGGWKRFFTREIRSQAEVPRYSSHIMDERRGPQIILTPSLTVKLDYNESVHLSVDL